MSVYTKIKELIQMSDFFNSSQMLRYKSQNEYRTFTGGIISIGIIITIIIGFASMIIDTLNLSTITFTETVIKDVNPSKTVMVASPQVNFMFGVQIWKLNLNDNVRYFDVSTSYQYWENGERVFKTIKMVPCTKEHWSNQPQLIKNYQTMMIYGWLCPTLDFQFEIFGKYTSEFYQNFVFSVNPCKNQTDPMSQCASQIEIDNLFAQNGDWFYFTFYFTNTIINPDHKTYKSIYLQDQTYVIFGKQLGAEAYLYITDFTITSDYSIWPFSQQQIDKGFLAEELHREHPYKITNNTAYLTFTIAKQARSLVYERQVQKISSVFSFIGGLIGAIMAVMFIINSYTRFSFQVSIASEIFKKSIDDQAKDQQAQQQKQRKSISVNFWHFIQYYIYQICKKLKIKLAWPNIHHIFECREQILHQLDIKSLIERLMFLQYSLTYIFQDYQIQGLHASKPITPKDIKKIRKKIQLYQYSEDQEKMQNQSEISMKSPKSLKEEIIEFNRMPAIIEKDIFTQIKNRNLTKSKTSNLLVNKIDNAEPPNRVRFKFPSIKSINFNEQIDNVSIQYDRSQKNCLTEANILQKLKISADRGNELSLKIWHKMKEQQSNEHQLKQLPNTEIPVVFLSISSDISKAFAQKS